MTRPETLPRNGKINIENDLLTSGEPVVVDDENIVSKIYTKMSKVIKSIEVNHSIVDVQPRSTSRLLFHDTKKNVPFK